MAARWAGKLFSPVYSDKLFHVEMSTLRRTPSDPTANFFTKFRSSDSKTDELGNSMFHVPALKDVASKEKRELPVTETSEW